MMRRRQAPSISVSTVAACSLRGASDMRRVVWRNRTALSFALIVTMCCDSHPNIQCEMNSDCNLHLEGACTAAPTGNHWCSYPDGSCSSGMRYSDQQVGDGVSGQCVAITPPASCTALPYTCGAGGSDNCCNSPTVIGGNYFRSFDVAGDSASGSMNA